MTTRHHEGFSLWDSKANPYNSVNYGPKRDIVREFVDACREYGLKIGFYSSLMDWHHPDGWRCAFDTQARLRFNAYIKALNRELLTQYGKIDILWFDVARPMETWEGWDSLELNQMVSELQPHILINNRSRLDEDFGTPEEHLTAMDRDWEACMTFNGISWGYVDSSQAIPYSYNAQRIIKMLNTVTSGGGNLLLNIGPMPDGSVPAEAVEPLTTVGKWLAENGKAVYGVKPKSTYRQRQRRVRRVFRWFQRLHLELDLADGGRNGAGRLHVAGEGRPAGQGRHAGGIRTARAPHPAQGSAQDLAGHPCRDRGARIRNLTARPNSTGQATTRSCMAAWIGPGITRSELREA